MCHSPKPARASVELADIFVRHAETYIAEHGVSAFQQKAVHAISRCRTSALGGLENIGRACLALILSNWTIKAKDTRLFAMNLKNHSSMNDFLDIILNKFVKSSLAFATPKVPH